MQDRQLEKDRLGEDLLASHHFLFYQVFLPFSLGFWFAPRSPGWPETHCGALDGIELEPPASRLSSARINSVESFFWGNLFS